MSRHIGCCSSDGLILQMLIFALTDHARLGRRAVYEAGADRENTCGPSDGCFGAPIFALKAPSEPCSSLDSEEGHMAYGYTASTDPQEELWRPESCLDRSIQRAPQLQFSVSQGRRLHSRLAVILLLCWLRGQASPADGAWAQGQQGWVSRRSVPRSPATFGGTLYGARGPTEGNLFGVGSRHATLHQWL